VNTRLKKKRKAGKHLGQINANIRNPRIPKRFRAPLKYSGIFQEHLGVYLEIIYLQTVTSTGKSYEILVVPLA